jgi:hypothetical protein
MPASSIISYVTLNAVAIDKKSMKTHMACVVAIYASI